MEVRRRRSNQLSAPDRHRSGKSSATDYLDVSSSDEVVRLGRGHHYGLHLRVARDVCEQDGRGGVDGWMHMSAMCEKCGGMAGCCCVGARSSVRAYAVLNTRDHARGRGARTMTYKQTAAHLCPRAPPTPRPCPRPVRSSSPAHRSGRWPLRPSPERPQRTHRGSRPRTHGTDAARRLPAPAPSPARAPAGPCPAYETGSSSTPPRRRDGPCRVPFCHGSGVVLASVGVISS